MEEDRDDSQLREFRLEGAGLFIIGGVFLVVMAAAFYLGRWVERRASGPDTGTLLTDQAIPGSTRRPAGRLPLILHRRTWLRSRPNPDPRSLPGAPGRRMRRCSSPPSWK